MAKRRPSEQEIRERLARSLAKTLLRKRGREWLETVYLLEEPELRQLVWELAGLPEVKRAAALELIDELRGKKKFPKCLSGADE